ncbi:FUSC family protein [Bradyrhizobium sp. Ai1a-2]|uniref:FUSC family protein n=1 Tax=Bradyrhizobium sp. Ai1a-2 TaxID=196490 RepID=UPI0003FF705E|nr:FUSC family protein [Bradyrhizobium sp. Ai1a-2]
MIAIIRGFSWRDGLFSLKSFAAAVLALYIAFELDLAQPSWSITTVYVVSQPLAGMVLAKSLYRVLGTVIGAVVSLVLVALFSNAPELFCLALALWIGAGTAVAIYLRDAPQAYVGTLSGYSAAIIGLPAALAPETAFDFAVARCLEIILGIACATLVHHLVFPRRAGAALADALSSTLPTMARWAGDRLSAESAEAEIQTDRRRMIAAVVSLEQLRVFANLDTPAVRAADSLVRLFEAKLLSLLAHLVSVHDRILLLRQRDPQQVERLRPLLQMTKAHIAAWTAPATPDDSRREAGDGTRIQAELDAAQPSRQELESTPNAFLVRNILLRLQDIIDIWRDAVWIRTHMGLGVLPPTREAAPSFQPYREPALALTGGIVAALTIVLVSLFWIYSAWPNGATAVTFAGIMCAIMGARDNPAAGALVFFRMTVVAAVISAAYLFVLLPRLDTFAALAVALAPLYLVCGLLLTVPQAIPMVIPLVFVAGGLIGISNQMTYDFEAFANNALGYLVGVGFGAISLALFRPFGREVAATRMIRGLLRDLSRVATAATPETRTAYESRTFDRINALLAQLDPETPRYGQSVQGGFAALRVGLNILILRRELPHAPPDVADAIERALAGLSAAFRATLSGRASASVAPLLESARHRALSAEGDLLVVADALNGIQTTLEQHGGFFFGDRRLASRSVSEAATA